MPHLPRLAAALGVPALLLVAGAGPAHAAVVADPAGDAPAGADVVGLTARADAATGTLSAAVRLTGTGGLTAGGLTVRFGRLDAAGACQTAGGPSVNFSPSSGRPTRNAVAQWVVPGSMQADRLTGTVAQQVPLVAATAVASLTDPALRTPLTCAEAETATLDRQLDVTAPVAIDAGALDPQVAGTAVQVTGRLLQAVPYDRAHLRIGVTCVSATSGRCAGTLRVRLQGSQRTAGTARIRLTSGATRTLSVLVDRAVRVRLVSGRRTFVVTASAAGQRGSTLAELSSVPAADRRQRSPRSAGVSGGVAPLSNAAVER